MIFWVILFFVTGILLIFTEFFLPGLILGTIGGMLILLSTVLGVYYYPDYAVFIIIGEVVGAFLGVVLGFWVLSRTRVGSMIMQQHAMSAESGYVSAESDLSLLNCEGTVLTALRPSGTIMVGDKRVDAVSDGTFIEKNKRVQVVQVNGSRVVVEEILDV
jgi:membrane-bound serine protease (ClpP class)